jgi:hypothetical protein
MIHQLQRLPMPALSLAGMARRASCSGSRKFSLRERRGFKPEPTNPHQQRQTGRRKWRTEALRAMASGLPEVGVERFAAAIKPITVVRPREEFEFNHGQIRDKL